jgi:hypothetical protein
MKLASNSSCPPVIKASTALPNVKDGVSISSNSLSNLLKPSLEYLAIVL